MSHNGKANRCSGKVRTELSDYYKSYRHKIHFKFNLKPEYWLAYVSTSAFYSLNYDNEIKFFSNGNDGKYDG